jgi:hypothetical protein
MNRDNALLGVFLRRVDSAATVAADKSAAAAAAELDMDDGSVDSVSNSNSGSSSSGNSADGSGDMDSSRVAAMNEIYEYGCLAQVTQVQAVGTATTMTASG